MCETIGDFYDYLHEIIEKHEKYYNIEDGEIDVKLVFYPLLTYFRPF